MGRKGGMGGKGGKSEMGGKNGNGRNLRDSGYVCNPH